MKWQFWWHLKLRREPSWHIPGWFLQYLAHAGVPLPHSAALPWDKAGSALKFYEFWFFNLHLVLGATVDDGAGPFILCLKYVWFTLIFHCLDSLPVVLAFLFQNSSLSINLSSSTCCIWIISLDMSMSPINIDALPFFLDKRENPKTNKLILLFM